MPTRPSASSSSEGAPRHEARLGSVTVGGDAPVVVMGALNVSPESFYGGSVYRDDAALLCAAAAMVDAGAAILDVGARSTAPYLDTAIDDDEEAARLARAVEVLAAKVSVPISADTASPAAARAALDAGAVVVNDVTALRNSELGRLVAARDASLIVMASPGAAGGADRVGTAVAAVHRILAGALARARAAGIPDARIVLDPGIGFFRDEAIPWDAWDAAIIANLAGLADLGRPLGVGVSRKSFLGAITGHADPADRLSASLAATAVAVLHGASMIRTHDVAATVDAVRVAERLRSAAASAALAEGPDSLRARSAGGMGGASAALAEGPDSLRVRSAGGMGGASAALAEGPDSLRVRSAGGMGGASRAPHID